MTCYWQLYVLVRNYSLSNGMQRSGMGHKVKVKVWHHGHETKGAYSRHAQSCCRPCISLCISQATSPCTSPLQALHACQSIAGT